MSLDWGVGKVENWETVCYQQKGIEDFESEAAMRTEVADGNWYYPKDPETGKKDKTRVERLHPITHDLIWASIPLKIGCISEENLGEFYLRYTLWQKLIGPTMHKRDPKTGEWVPLAATLDQIRAHIGMHTNVRTESWVTFLHYLGDQVRDTFLPKGLKDNRQPGWVHSPSQAIQDVLPLMEAAAKRAREFSRNEDDGALEYHIERMERACQHFDSAATDFEYAENTDEE